MRSHLYCILAAALQVCFVLASNFEAPLSLIVKHHGQNTEGLSKTIDTLTKITTKLKEEPGEVKYRSIRLLNEAFWETVGSVNGGISFMTALGFDLVELGESCSTVFHVCIFLEF